VSTTAPVLDSTFLGWVDDEYLAERLARLQKLAD
jgi:hypothetical protein